MKLVLSCLGLVLCSAAAFAQGLKTFDNQIVPQKVLNVYRLYPEDKAGKISAPCGYEAVYLTHYGRHGSRYVKSDSQYANVAEVLRRSSEKGKLTAAGQRLWAEYSAVYPSLEGKTMNLTPLGLQQHRGIASRLAANFPELFAKGATVEAMASRSSRTEQSMDAFCGTLSESCPDVVIEKVPARMKALNPYSSSGGVATERDLYWNSDAPYIASVDSLRDALVDYDAFAARIFNDPLWARDSVKLSGFMSDLYYVAICMPNTPEAGLDLCRYLTLSEMVALCKVDCWQGFCCKGRCTLFGGTTRPCALSSYILEDMVENAVSDIQSGRYSARLRFGHDGCFMGMFALLGIEPWNCSCVKGEEASLAWDQSRTPMACNLQTVVYRNKRGKTLVQVLYNENDFDLPIMKVRGKYYRSEDLLRFCRSKISEAKQILGQ